MRKLALRRSFRIEILLPGKNTVRDFAMKETKRLSKDAYFMALARAAAARATCKRRQVGCVLVDRNGHIVGTGYNGVPRGEVHCLDVPCEGAYAPSGMSLTKCRAIHAEANALLQCADVMNIEYAYVTASPCTECTKLLKNTSCRVIVYDEPYPQGLEDWADDSTGYRKTYKFEEGM